MQPKLAKIHNIGRNVTACKTNIFLIIHGKSCLNFLIENISCAKFATYCLSCLTYDVWQFIISRSQKTLFSSSLVLIGHNHCLNCWTIGCHFRLPFMWHRARGQEEMSLRYFFVLQVFILCFLSSRRRLSWRAKRLLFSEWMEYKGGKFLLQQC